MGTVRKVLFVFFCLTFLAGCVLAYLNLGPALPQAFQPSPQKSATQDTPAQDSPNEEPAPVLLIPVTEIQNSSEEEEKKDSLPVGKLIVTGERKQYTDALLTLRIPALNLTCSVYNGTDAETLGKMGAGLYDYAQLPGRGNRNTSMAGHRNTRRNGIITDKAPFYYIDTLKEGDFIYLSDEESIYRYLWEFCEIVEADDWSMIRTTNYSCVTITSCHPIGISDHRIVVRGILDDIIPYQEDFEFKVSVN